MSKLLQTVSASLLAIAGCAVVNSANASFKSNLTVELDGIQNQRGQVCVRLFSSSQGFPDGATGKVTRQCSKINDSSMTFSFNNLTSGSYALAAFHDQNGDGKLNRNSVGMPTEGYGFSNNPAITRSGPPKYGQTIFLLAGPNTTIKIRMRYTSG